ncbi:MAG: sigma-54-dependent transcriptional regulator [Puniceicoccaceae bacterium]
MATLFRDGRAQQEAAKLSRLIYCNPFTPERLSLEQELLGPTRVESGREWNLDPRNKTRHVNMEHLGGLAEEIVQECRPTYLSGAGSDEEKALYANLVIFVLYVTTRSSLDAMIEQAHQTGTCRLKVSGYGKFNQQFHHYFEGAEPVAPDHLFACYFQIRRAFYHIFRFFVGTSRAATRLRARMWQSIFTHDLFRYQRSLYGRMATVPTLITGPSGSGKEVVARAIGFSRYVAFDPGKRSFVADFTKGFYPVNLSALSPTLIESELFGHRKGAFTGALQDREGFFSACGEDGTVFLDEIGDTSLDIQVKLLRVLQTRQFQRLGDVKGEPFKGKILAATNRDLVAEIADGCFREDFYFRLRSDVIETVSLDEMVNGNEDELRFLAGYAAVQLAGEPEAPGLVEDFMQWARERHNYKWPGNFRELEQALRSILIHGTYEPPVSSRNDDDLPGRLAATGWTLKELTEHYVTALYRETPVYEELARKLGVDRRTVKKYLRDTDA